MIEAKEPAVAADVQQMLASAVRHYSSGDLGEAEKLCREILSRNPGHANTLHLLGLIVHRNGDLARAIELLDRSIALNPQEPQFFFNRGNIYLAAGQPDQALADYRNALRLRPNDAEAHNNLGNALFHKGAYREAQHCYETALRLRPDLLEARHNLGNAYKRLGNPAAAIEAFRAVLHLHPDSVEAHKGLADTLFELGCKEEALVAYEKVLQLRPDYSEVRYKLAALAGRDAPEAAPADYVAALFDSYAPDFDRELVGKLQYHSPERLRALLTPFLDRKDYAVLDLGCGTGLCGVHFKDVARSLTGVDLSAEMIKKTRERGLYDRLLQEDLLTALARAENEYDLVLAADVFVYCGNLAPVFAGVARVLVPMGFFAFSVEESENTAKDYDLRSSGRYAHAGAYLERLAQTHGLALLASERFVLRRDRGTDIPGLNVIMRRGASA
jgi:predicted TPR repeat methyltransferase